jgi:peroxiredoxin
LVQLAGWKDRFAELGVNVAGMTYDDQTVLAKFHAENELGYPMLQDVDVKHVDAYGIRNMSYESGDRGYGIPEPGILYLGPDGAIRAKFAVPGYRSRPPFEAVYQSVSELVSRQNP